MTPPEPPRPAPDGSVDAAGDTPFLPPPQPAAEPAAETTAFDAKAMVEAQRPRIHAAYGDLPAASDESRAALSELRELARAKRRRNRWLGWYVALGLLLLVLAAAFLAYRSFRDEQERRSNDPAAESFELLPSAVHAGFHG